eukprot:SAG31_NODE_1785_length_7278_cov_4.205321_13_plen_65_part_00
MLESGSCDVRCPGLLKFGAPTPLWLLIVLVSRFCNIFGTAQVIVNEKKVAELAAGATFGELALM